MSESRIVALIDMDCFYCQVEARLNPLLKGKPMAVVQYNQWKGGGIIAVNYEARDRGVTRHMRGEEAKKHCPEIQLVSVPCVRGKADLTRYRDAGREVVKVLCGFSECVQRASVDEAYIDLTMALDKLLAHQVKVSLTQLENTFVVGYSPNGSNDEGEREAGVVTWLEEVYQGELSDPELHRLATAAALVEQIRAAVFHTTGFHCSAGISHNKILAKLVCGLHKPQKQTVLPMSSVPELFRSLPVKKVRNLGGKLGDDVVDRLGVTFMGDLITFTEKQLQVLYDDKTGTWLYNIARGIDLDPVTPQLISKSIGCRKNFPGKTALASRANVTHWVSELAAEVAERLDEDLNMNKRRAQLMTVHLSQEVGGRDVAMSRSVPLPGYEAEKIAACALNVLSKYNSAPPSSDLWDPPLKYLGISTAKFVDLSGNMGNSIDKFFRAVPTSSTTTTDTIEENDTMLNKNVRNSRSGNGINESNKEAVIEDNKNVLAHDSNKAADLIEGETHQLKYDNYVGCTSFFERYFKNRQNKINNKTSVKINKPEGKCCNDSNNSPFIEQSHNLHIENNNLKESDKKAECIDSFDKIYEENLNKLEETFEKNDELWISPSEIFPDLDNIDDSLINILPSPLQRKISKIKQNKDNLSSRLSTDSDCAPTRIETVADVYPSPRENTPVNNLPMCLPSSTASRKDEDVIETENLFNNTSLDLFESQSNIRHDPEHQNTVCEKCKEHIAECYIQEHLDYHMAMELQDQLNSQVRPIKTTATSETRTNKGVLCDRKKRGRPSKKDVVASKKSRTIKSFFTKT